jgi:hypothetical protein
MTGGGGGYIAVLKYTDSIGYIHRAAILGKNGIDTFQAE